MNRWVIAALGVALWLGGCKADDDVVSRQNTSFESYLKGANAPYAMRGGVYQYVANSGRSSYATDKAVTYGDSVIFNFAAYTFGSPLGTLFYTNVLGWLSSRDAALDVSYWDMTPRRIRYGVTPLMKGLSNGLAGSRENDSLMLFINSDLAYGDKGLGTVDPDQATVWVVKINKVVKQ